MRQKKRGKLLDKVIYVMEEIRKQQSFATRIMFFVGIGFLDSSFTVNCRCYMYSFEIKYGKIRENGHVAYWVSHNSARRDQKIFLRSLATAVIESRFIRISIKSLVISI